MAKLTKGQKDGIRLIADIFVIEDILKNVFSKDKTLSPHAKALREHLQSKIPLPFEAEQELKQQIKLVREEWLEQIGSWEVN